MTRRRILPIGLVLVFILVFSIACVPTPTPHPLVRITLTGADSMQWIARALGNAYVRDHPDVTISVQVANSAEGIRAANTYPRTIGLVSRTIKPNELDRTRAVVVARDGIAVIVNQKNPINAIMHTQITQVFDGDILTWPAGPNAGQNIVVVSREEGSGTRDAFETMVMNKQRVTPTAVVMPGEAAAVDYVAQHPDSIGYASMGALTPEVRALTVDDITLSVQSVESQKYPFVRTLAFVVPLEPDPELQEFLNYVLSPEAQAMIAQRYGRAP